MVNDHYVKALDGAAVVAVMFGGGFGIVRKLSARTIHVNEKHPHICNLARVVAEPNTRRELLRMLRWTDYSQETLRDCQDVCKWIDEGDGQSHRPHSLNGWTRWAHAYFVSAWMSRNGTAGTKNEFTASLSTRYAPGKSGKPGGGDSVVRFVSAMKSLVRFGQCLERATIHEGCFRDFAKRFKDAKGLAIYSDSPWDGPGDGYRYPFTEQDHRDVATILNGYQHARVVVRINDTPLIRELYPEETWQWTFLSTRDQHNNSGKREVMIFREGS